MSDPISKFQNDIRRASTRLKSKSTIRFFALSCTPTAFLKHSYTSEQPPFLTRISKPGVLGPNSRHCGTSPARIAIIAQTSSPIFVCFVPFVVPSVGRYERATRLTKWLTPQLHSSFPPLPPVRGISLRHGDSSGHILIVPERHLSLYLQEKGPLVRLAGARMVGSTTQRIAYTPSNCPQIATCQTGSRAQ